MPVSRTANLKNGFLRMTKKSLQNAESKKLTAWSKLMQEDL
jgi:hypothetical protein